jgi:hypothetical protein
MVPARKVVRRLSPGAPSSNPGNRTKKQVSPEQAKTLFKPGESGNPSGRPKEGTRPETVRQFLSILAKPFPGNGHTYAEELMRVILRSEHLTAKLMDKLMPTLTPEQVTNVLSLGGQGAFEERLAALRLQREALGQLPTIEGQATPVSRTDQEG